jgi:hypothetical protein
MLELAVGALASSRVAAGQGANDAQAALPSLACVRALRSARISRLREDSAAELADLRGALLRSASSAAFSPVVRS